MSHQRKTNSSSAAQQAVEAVAARLRPGGRAAWAEHNSLGVTVAANFTSADANTHGSSHRAAVRVAARLPAAQLNGSVVRRTHMTAMVDEFQEVRLPCTCDEP